MKKLFLFVVVLQSLVVTGCKQNDATEVSTTINVSLQTAVDSLLKEKMTEIYALHGQVIVMEVETGAIKALVGLQRNFDGQYVPCENFVYQQEMGSIMKTASLLACLETGKAKLTDVVDVGNGVWQIDDGRIMNDHNWRRGGYGEITLDRAIEISSNIAIGKTVWKLFEENTQDFFDLLDKMSYGQPDSIEGIAGLKPTIYSSPKDSTWDSKRIIWSAIGYERKIAPIQVLTFYNAIANDGKMVKPTLQQDKVEIINKQIANKENVSLMQEVLEHAVSQGLGKRAGSPSFKVAGKTTTSRVDNLIYNDNEAITGFQVGFCGFFPADAPKYSMIVSMNKLGLPASGGGMAGELFHYIVEWMNNHKMVK